MSKCMHSPKANALRSCDTKVKINSSTGYRRNANLSLLLSFPFVVVLLPSCHLASKQKRNDMREIAAGTSAISHLSLGHGTLDALGTFGTLGRPFFLVHPLAVQPKSVETRVINVALVVEGPHDDVVGGGL